MHRSLGFERILSDFPILENQTKSPKRFTQVHEGAPTVDDVLAEFPNLENSPNSHKTTLRKGSPHRRRGVGCERLLLPGDKLFTPQAQGCWAGLLDAGRNRRKRGDKQRGNFRDLFRISRTGKTEQILTNPSDLHLSSS